MNKLSLALLEVIHKKLMSSSIIANFVGDVTSDSLVSGEFNVEPFADDFGVTYSLHYAKKTDAGPRMFLFQITAVLTSSLHGRGLGVKFARLSVKDCHDLTAVERVEQIQVGAIIMNTRNNVEEATTAHVFSVSVADVFKYLFTKDLSENVAALHATDVSKAEGCDFRADFESITLESAIREVEPFICKVDTGDVNKTNIVSDTRNQQVLITHDSQIRSSFCKVLMESNYTEAADLMLVKAGFDQGYFAIRHYANNVDFNYVLSVMCESMIGKAIDSYVAANTPVVSQEDPPADGEVIVH